MWPTHVLTDMHHDTIVCGGNFSLNSILLLCSCKYIGFNSAFQHTYRYKKNSKIFISFQTYLNLYYFPRIFCPTLSGTAQRYLHLKSKNPQQAFLRFLVKCIFHSGCERWLSYVVHANVLRDMESVLNEFHL